MTLIDFMAGIFGDGPWTLEAATRNALRAAERHHRPFEAVEVEPGRWVAKPVPGAVVTAAGGRIVAHPTIPAGTVGRSAAVHDGKCVRCGTPVPDGTPRSRVADWLTWHDAEECGG